MPLKSGSSGYTTNDDPVRPKFSTLDDQETEVDEVGEICVRPRVPFAVFNGYYNEPHKSLETFRNMWHHSATSAAGTPTAKSSSSTARSDSAATQRAATRPRLRSKHIARQFLGPKRGGGRRPTPDVQS